MIALYLVAGLTVSLILYGFNTDSETNKSTFHLKKLLPAVVLTSCFWPIVMMLISFEAMPKPKARKPPISYKDLILPVNIESVEHSELIKDPNAIAPDLPFGHLHSKWQNLKQKTNDKNTIWAFKTQPKQKSNKDIVEGYALVDSNKQIVDYLVTAKYKESYGGNSNTAIH